MFTLNCKGRILTLDSPLVMGILTMTPDSFYQGSRNAGKDELLRNASKMIEDGADILDIGGQSTRPGAKAITVDEELHRVVSAISVLKAEFPDAVISVDTYRSKVAKEAVDAGASIVNDISAGSLDEKMIETVAALKVPYVLMHMRGTPETMQQLTQYDNLVREVIDYFIAKLEMLKKAGIGDIIIDPGFGFAKTAEQNFQLLKNLQQLSILGHPILAGISRKATIYKTLGITADEALNGTTVLNTVALLNGASILRVHDVKEAREAVTLVRQLAN